MDIEQLKQNIIYPVLAFNNLYNPEAEAMLIATCLQETQAGKFVKLNKYGAVPSLGIYQMTSYTHDTIWRTQLMRPDQKKKVRDCLMFFNFVDVPKAEQMIWNVGYATFMARIFYLYINRPLPAFDDVEGQWKFYKAYWQPNTESNLEEFTKHLNNFTKVKAKK